VIEGLVSVVLPVYNGEKYLTEAINSILCQTYSYFELVVIIDGSKDNSLAVAESFQDARIKIFVNEVNLGLVGALNRGLDNCNGEFIARMDQDDISLPDRLSKQVYFLERNADIDIVGSMARSFGFENSIRETPRTDQEIKIQLYFQNPFCHPSVLMRASIFENKDKRYSPDFKDIEDWALWHDLSLHGHKMANIPEVLLKYRISGQSTTPNASHIRELQYSNVYRKTLKDLFDDVTDDIIRCHMAVNTLLLEEISVKELCNYLRVLKKNIIKKKSMEIKLTDEFFKRLSNRIFFKLCDNNLSNALVFMFRFHLFSLPNFRYLFSKIRFSKKS